MGGGDYLSMRRRSLARLAKMLVPNATPQEAVAIADRVMKMKWPTNTVLDSFGRPYPYRTSQFSEAELTTTINNLPPSNPSHVAAVAYIQLGPWPPWTHYLVRAAAANRANVAFYFIGAQLPMALAAHCASCYWLPFDAELMQRRIEARLDMPHGSVRISGTKKICDLKPMWLDLFPELTQRHQWFGFADSDILLGNISAEVEALRPADELLVPMPFFPHPIANGNFMLMRSVPKMLQAYKRNPQWRAMLQDKAYTWFDEWGSHKKYGSMAAVYQDMLLSSELRVRPTLKMFVQDSIFRRDHRVVDMAQSTSLLSLDWRRGALTFERKGACVCGDGVAAAHGPAACHECVKKPGEMLRNVTVHRKLEIMGFHVQTWKKSWKSAELIIAAANSSLNRPAPPCDAEVFALTKRGFRCSL